MTVAAVAAAMFYEWTRIVRGLLDGGVEQVNAADFARGDVDDLDRGEFRPDAERVESEPEVVARLLPWAWLGFGVQVVTGALLFSSEAVKIYGNPAFRLKMLLLLLAGIQALIFQTVVSRKLPAWDGRPALR